VGGTLKLVHGVAAAEETTRPVDIDVAGNLPGRGSNEFDADIGAMLTTRAISVGVSVRNLFEPSFAVDDGPPIQLERRVRAGVSVPITVTLRVSADVDFTKVSSSGGPWRDAAVGGEGRVTARVAVRAGVHWNTAGETVGGAAPIGSVGGSYRVFGTILADGQVTFGSRNGDRGWGVGARIVF
jgi:hypothetical protein